ncbi:lysine--tRNA ligase [candidate division KSB1 bacterium]|nr:MAG: lysine--tRNA ligase [candidate division KSB1 bacterium]
MTTPPDSEHHEEELNEILRLRREKLDKLRANGVNPYPYRFEKDSHIPDLLKDFDSKLETEEHTGPLFSIAGRIHTMRIMGKASFCNVRDESGEMQVYVQRDRVGEAAYEAFRHLFDIGDIVGVRGTAFRTKTNEPTLRAQSVELLSKSLHPLPVVKEHEGQVFDAFTDKESRYRQRYLDLAVNLSVRAIFRTRAKIISAMREFLDKRGYLEVETPALQPLYGGALAKPFTAHYNVLDRDFFLRIADELYLKRLLTGGYEKVYELSKDFRNEGMDKFHNPEFTMLEFYQAYADYQDIMNLSEELFRFVAQTALGKTEVTYQGKTVDFGKPFHRVTFYGLLKEATGCDLLEADARELADVALKHDVAIKHTMGEGKILDEIMKTLVRPNLLEPTFIYDYPLSLSPLAKKNRFDSRLVERFQPFALGFELGNAFSELNDPLDQRERFEAQRRLKDAGDEETQPVDEDYLRALEIGMPPTGGMGIGVDRLTMLLTDQSSIREVILFPQLRT